MVDITVNSAELNDGVLTITGSGFTKTTTSVYLDDNQTTTPFEVWSDGEIRLNVENVTEITVTKGDITRTITVARGGGPEAAEEPQPDPQTGNTGSGESPSQTTTQEADSDSGPFDPGGDVHEEGYKTAEDNVTPGDLVEDDLKTMTDVSPEQLGQAGNAGAEEKQRMPEPDRRPYAEGEHLDHDFRFRVEGTAVVPVEHLGIGPRDPYPEGNPPDPEEVFKELHGYPRPPADDDQAPQAGPAAAAAQTQEAR